MELTVSFMDQVKARALADEAKGLDAEAIGARLVFGLLVERLEQLNQGSRVTMLSQVDMIAVQMRMMSGLDASKVDEIARVSHSILNNSNE